MADLVDDLDTTVAAATTALLGVVDSNWSIPAANLTWTCRGTIEHVADDLFAYAGQIAPSRPEVDTYVAFDFFADREGDPPCAVHAKSDRGNAGLVQIVDACGGMLSALARTRPADVRGWHTYGVSDPHGFAAMGTVEVLLHLYDVAGPLGLTWDPHPDVVRRALERLFPDAPTDGDPWQVLLSTTGRDPERPLDDWTWDATVREPPRTRRRCRSTHGTTVTGQRASLISRPASDPTTRRPARWEAPITIASTLSSFATATSSS